MNTKNKLGIHFVGLTPKETALFERVISFNVTHGLEATIEDDAINADLIIVTTESFTSVDQYSNNKTIVVIANEVTTTQGDFQLCRPLMITKAMGALTDAINLSEEKQSSVATDETTGLIDVKIEDAEITNDSPSTEPLNEESVETETAADIVVSTTHHALIIDDSASIRKQLELELRDAGISSDFAECGEDALEIIKDTHFDLVFLDIIMPGLDGYETCKAMRTTPSYKKTPIIMLSGKTSPLDEVQGVIAGATTYLTKPVKSDKLQETLSRVTKWIENYAPPRQTESV